MWGFLRHGLLWQKCQELERRREERTEKEDWVHMMLKTSDVREEL